MLFLNVTLCAMYVHTQQHRAALVTSISSLTSCFIPREWARQNACTKHRNHIQNVIDNFDDVALVVLTDDFMNEIDRNFSLANKQRYCDRHGYQFYSPNVSAARALAGPYPLPWGKFWVVQQLLQQHEFVLCLDVDTIIHNPQVSLSFIINDMRKHRKMLAISRDGNGVNSGVFMMRRCAESALFLQQAIESASLLAHDTFLPLKYENRAFFYLLDEWPMCFGYRRIDSVSAPQYNATLAYFFQSHTLYLDRCQINVRPKSGSDHIFSSSMSYDFWDHHTFILHLAGGNTASKTTSLQEYAHSWRTMNHA